MEKYSLKMNPRAIFLLLLLVGTQDVNSLRLDSNGGYHFTVALAHGTNEPSNLTEFLGNLRSNIQKFSELLFTATKNRFFVNSTTFVLPYHWDAVEDEKVTATIDNYNTADVRLSRSIDAPHVENPNICGLPGNYIELPLEFFQNNSTFGLPYKALLVTWARYRWGTWEEHGYPGNRHFPYFYNNGSDWLVTGCSDIPLEGDLTNIGNKNCDSDELYPPEGGCRFVPDPDQTQQPQSSLSYLHWLPSVNSFCSEDTHNADSPNKQNLYCGYRSISEVILNSPDGVSVTDSVSAPPDINFQINYENRKPLLYLLIDGSRFRTHPDLYNSIKVEMRKLFNQTVLQDIPTKAAVFPPAPGSPGNLEEIVPLDLILNQEEELANSIVHFQTGGRSAGSFSAAINDAINELSSYKNPAGAVILVLKHGVGADAFDSENYELDMLSRLKEERIILHALEISDVVIDPKLHLLRLAQESGGSYLAIRPPILTLSGYFLRTVISSFDSAVVTNRTVETIFKRYFSPIDSEEFVLPLGEANLPDGSVLLFKLTTSRIITGVDSTNMISLVEQAEAVKFVSQTYEFDDAANGNNRKIFNYEMTLPVDGIGEKYTFEYQNSIDYAWLHVSVQYPNDYVFPDELFDIDITVSEPEVNLENPNTSLQIFAKITLGGQPIVGLTNVEAILHNHENRSSSLPTVLRDDGVSSVDVASGDGIYSGITIPDDGTYFITVMVTALKPTPDFLEDYFHEDSAIQRLLPMNQTSIGCRSNAKGCAVTIVERSGVKFQQMTGSVSVRNRDLFTPFAARILDLDAKAMDNFQVSLSWTVPAILGSETPETDFVYEIRSSTSPENLRRDFDNAENNDPDSSDSISFIPGDRCVMRINLAGEDTTFFAVRLSYNSSSTADATPPSNIAMVTPEQTPITPTTTTTTLATPAPTTRRTTTTKTPLTSTEMTSEPPSTTEKEEKLKYWYQKTEGIVTLSVFGAGLLILIIGLVLVRVLSFRTINALKEKAQKQGKKIQLSSTP